MAKKAAKKTKPKKVKVIDNTKGRYNLTLDIEIVNKAKKALKKEKKENKSVSQEYTLSNRVNEFLRDTFK